jgi:hypothetical protein
MSPRASARVAPVSPQRRAKRDGGEIPQVPYPPGVTRIACAVSLVCRDASATALNSIDTWDLRMGNRAIVADAVGDHGREGENLATSGKGPQFSSWMVSSLPKSATPRPITFKYFTDLNLSASPHRERRATRGDQRATFGRRHRPAGQVAPWSGDHTPRWRRGQTRTALARFGKFAKPLGDDCGRPTNHAI